MKKEIAYKKSVIPKTITYRFYNSFTNEFLGSFPVVYDRFKATTGYYHKRYLKWKLFLANEDKIEKSKVMAHIIFEYV